MHILKQVPIKHVSPSFYTLQFLMNCFMLWLGGLLPDHMYCSHVQVRFPRIVILPLFWVSLLLAEAVLPDPALPWWRLVQLSTFHLTWHWQKQVLFSSFARQPAASLCSQTPHCPAHQSPSLHLYENVYFIPYQNKTYLPSWLIIPTINNGSPVSNKKTSTELLHNNLSVLSKVITNNFFVSHQLEGRFSPKMSWFDMWY